MFATNVNSSDRKDAKYVRIQRRQNSKHDVVSSCQIVSNFLWTVLYVLAGRIMKMKNICHDRHDPTDGSTTLYLGSLHKIRVPYMHYSSVANPSTQLNKSFALAGKARRYEMSAFLPFGQPPSGYSPFCRFINAHRRRASVTKNFPYDLTKLYFRKRTTGKCAIGFTL